MLESEGFWPRVGEVLLIAFGTLMVAATIAAAVAYFVRDDEPQSRAEWEREIRQSDAPQFEKDFLLDPENAELTREQAEYLRSEIPPSDGKFGIPGGP